jgi:subfamily B ATP-binding cassette protein MsbA
VDKTTFVYRSCRFENPPIMILDETTSAWIPKICCSSALEHMMQNRTSIVMHIDYPPFKSRCHCGDAKGKIVEQNHEELMALQGVYNKLVSLQSLSS